MPLDEQSQCLHQFVIGNQQYEISRSFYGIFIGPAAFSAFMSKIFRPLILSMNLIAYLDKIFVQPQTKTDADVDQNFAYVHKKHFMSSKHVKKRGCLGKLYRHR